MHLAFFLWISDLSKTNLGESLICSKDLPRRGHRTGPGWAAAPAELQPIPSLLAVPIDFLTLQPSADELKGGWASPVLPALVSSLSEVFRDHHGFQDTLPQRKCGRREQKEKGTHLPLPKATLPRKLWINMSLPLDSKYYAYFPALAYLKQERKGVPETFTKSENTLMTHVDNYWFT